MEKKEFYYQYDEKNLNKEIDNIKIDSFIMIICKIRDETRIYTGIVSGVNKEHISLKVAMQVSHHKNSTKIYPSGIQGNYSIPRTWIAEIESAPMKYFSI